MDVVPGVLPIYNSTFIISMKRGSLSATRCKLGPYSSVLYTANPAILMSDVIDPSKATSKTDEVNRLICQLFTNNTGQFELELEWEGTGMYQRTGVFMNVHDRSVVS